jgi:hypothetical protein
MIPLGIGVIVFACVFGGALGGMFLRTIHSQKERPENAYVAVQYRGWWFYIADDDQSSKATFSLLNILFSLQSETARANHRS